MPIKRSSTNADIEKWVQGRVDLFFSQIMRALHNVGLKAVTISRQKHRYTDRTGNLTSSIGYVIVENGKIVKDNFRLSQQGTDKNTGYNSGKEYAKEVASGFTSGLQLIIVAGMPYATYVEAMGLDVLDSARLYSQKELTNKINDVIKLWQN